MDSAPNWEHMAACGAALNQRHQQLGLISQINPTERSWPVSRPRPRPFPHFHLSSAASSTRGWKCLLIILNNHSSLLWTALCIVVTIIMLQSHQLILRLITSSLCLNSPTHNLLPVYTTSDLLLLGLFYFKTESCCCFYRLCSDSGLIHKANKPLPEVCHQLSLL